MRATSLVTILNTTNLTVNLTLRNSLSGFTTNILVVVFHPFGINSFVRKNNAVNAIRRVRLFAAAVIAPRGTAIVIPGSGLKDSGVVGCATGSYHQTRTLINVDCDSSVSGTHRTVLRRLSRRPGVLGSPRPVMMITTLTSDDISLRI